MYIRSAWLGGLLTLILGLGLAPSLCSAADWHIGGGSGSNSFATLEEFRIALNNNQISLGDGDTILIYKDDRSLTENLVLPDQWAITIKSVGGTHIVSNDITSVPGPFNIFGVYGASPNLTVENVHMLGNRDYNFGTIQVSSNNNDGNLTIANSVFENNKQGVNYSGGGTIDIINSTFTNNMVANAITVYNFNPGDVTNLNVYMNNQAADRIVWEGNPSNGGVAAIEVTVSGEANLNFDIASGKTLDIRDDIAGTHVNFGTINIEKNGGGVLKLGGGAISTVEVNNEPIYRGQFDFQVNSGTVHFTVPKSGGDSYWMDPFGSIAFKSGSVYKPTLTPGNLEDVMFSDSPWTGTQHSILVADTFNSQEGSRLEIGMISTFPEINLWSDKNTTSQVRVWKAVAFLGDCANSSIASTMRINNKLLDASLKFGQIGTTGDWEAADPEDWDGMFIRIDRLESLTVLEGVGEYADVYRKLTTLSDTERDMLDSIYCRGGLTGEDRAYFQTLSGSIVTNSLLSMRHNWTNLLRKINRRMTDFQHEELMENDDLGISGQGYASYCQPRANPIIDYPTLWASVDQSWMYQDDLDSLAGYRFNTAGLNIGVDRHIDNYIFGGVIRYDNGEMKLKSNRATKTETETVMASLYGSWAEGGMYITGGLHAGYGWNESFSNYRTAFNSLTAKTDNYSTTLYGAHVETGYMWETSVVELPLRVTPYGGMGYAKMHRQATTEHGGGNLDRHFRRGDWDLWEAAIGVKLAMPINRGSYILTPSADIAWNRTLGDPRNEHGDVNLLADPNGTWRVSSMGANRSALRGSFGLNAHFFRNMDVGAAYDVEWRDSFWSHQVNVNFSLGF